MVIEFEPIMSTIMPCESLVEISFPSNEYAEMVKSCLEIDEELQPNKLIKEFQVDKNILKVLVITFVNLF